MEKVTGSPIENRLHDVRQIPLLGSLGGGRQDEGDALDDLELDRRIITNICVGRIRLAPSDVCRLLVGTPIIGAVDDGLNLF